MVEEASMLRSERVSVSFDRCCTRVIRHLAMNERDQEPGRFVSYQMRWCCGRERTVTAINVSRKLMIVLRWGLVACAALLSSVSCLLAGTCSSPALVLSFLRSLLLLVCVWLGARVGDDA